MLYGILIAFHVIACVVLIGIVLVQAGRGGGLTETFSGAESIFGTKTNSFLTRATTVLAILFFVTCLSLAFISKQRSRSLLEGKRIPVKSVPAEQEPSNNAQAKPQDASSAAAAQTTQGAVKAQEAQAQNQTPKPTAPIETAK